MNKNYLHQQDLMKVLQIIIDQHKIISLRCQIFILVRIKIKKKKINL